MAEEQVEPRPADVRHWFPWTEIFTGFKIALEDLEIRGAGNLLGHEQSGFIHAVGFDLYCRMLRKAIEEQQKTKTSK